MVNGKIKAIRIPEVTVFCVASNSRGYILLDEFALKLGLCSPQDKLITLVSPCYLEMSDILTLSAVLSF